MYKLPPGQNWSFLLGAVVSQVCISEYSVALKFANDIEITINDETSEESFRHYGSALIPQNIHGMPGRAATLVSLLGQHVVRVVAEDDKTLSIEFSNVEKLAIFDNSDAFESFTIACPQGVIVV